MSNLLQKEETSSEKEKFLDETFYNSAEIQNDPIAKRMLENLEYVVHQANKRAEIQLAEIKNAKKKNFISWLCG